MKIIIKDFVKNRKIQAIKVLREIFTSRNPRRMDLGLKEAKEIMDRVGSGEDVEITLPSYSTQEKALAAFRDVGVQVELTKPLTIQDLANEGLGEMKDRDLVMEDGIVIARVLKPQSEEAMPLLSVTALPLPLEAIQKILRVLKDV